MSVKIYTRDAERIGTRPALVLLPAFPFDHRMWDAVARRFEGLPVVAVDPPGFGGSPLPTEPPGLEIYADWVAESLRARGISRAVFAGSSMGGYVALALLERHPQLVKGMAMVGSHGDIDTPSQRGKRTELAIDAMMGRAQAELAANVENLFSVKTKTQHPELVALAKQWISEAKDEAIAWAVRAMAARPGRIGVMERRDAVPCLVMRGTEDNSTTLRQARAIASAGRTEVMEVEDAGHLLPIEAPGVVARALIRLYAQVRD